MGKKAQIPEDVLIPPEIAMYGNRFVRKWQASATTYHTYSAWWHLFYTAAINRFKWEGLPPEIDERFFETTLFLQGSIALTRRTAQPTDLIPYVAATYATEGKLDAYNNPNKIRMTSANGQQWVRHANMWIRRTGNQYKSSAKLMAQNACICWDNLARLPLYNVIDLACRRLAEFDQTIDQHVRAQRVPYIFNVPEEGKANAEDMYNQIESGQPAIYLTPNVTNVMQIQVLETGGDYIADKLLNDELV